MKNIYKAFFCFYSLAFFSGCSSFFYYPTSVMYVDRKKIPLNIEDHFFLDSKKNKIHAWYIHAKESPKGKILFFHGNAQNLSSHFGMLVWVVDYHYDLMIFDYPGYGLSEGEPTPESTVLSGVAALEKIQSLNPELPLFLYGQSLGGQILQKSINLKNDINYCAVIIESSFLSYRSVARSVLARHWLTWIFQPLAWLSMSDQWAGDPSLISPKPLYVLHGTQDPVVAFSQGQQIYDRAKDPKEFIPIENGGHGNTYYFKKEIYRDTLIKILNKHAIN